ncbi:hypothetical protein GS440_17420 [Rhodococcus hoagii]|nr:hypothetical protein [Prescottella equi]
MTGLDELSDENEDERRDFQDPTRDPFESEHGPVAGTDGDDNPEYARPKHRLTNGSGRSVKVKLANGKTSTVEIIEPGDLTDPVGGRRAPAENPAGQMVAAGHGFAVKDERSRPWKSAKRTHCAYCAGPMPTPEASGHPCEFDPHASAAELNLVGAEQGPDNRPAPLWDYWPGQQDFERLQHPGCQCNGCNLRWQVANGTERNVGQPKMCCSKACATGRDNERNAWRREVKSAEKRGDVAPPEPEDRGLKFVIGRGPRSTADGSYSRA